MAVINYEAQLAFLQPITLEQAMEEAEAGEYYIMRQPEDAEVAAYGDTATFHCDANDSQAAYDWYYSDDGTTWDSAGSSSTDLEITVTQATIGRQYMCVATFQDGETGTSNPARASLGE